MWTLNKQLVYHRSRKISFVLITFWRCLNFVCYAHCVLSSCLSILFVSVLHKLFFFFHSLIPIVWSWLSEAYSSCSCCWLSCTTLPLNIHIQSSLSIGPCLPIHNTHPNNLSLLSISLSSFVAISRFHLMCLFFPISFL